MSARVTVALDVDGVLCPMVDPDDPHLHERETGWEYSSPAGLPSCVIATPVVQTLLELGGEGVGHASRGRRAKASSNVEVLWHSSWRLEASQGLAPALGAGHLTGGADRMFATVHEYRDRGATWWKLVAIERWLQKNPATQAGPNPLLIWIDDDINAAVRSGEIAPELLRDPRVALISPATNIGINAVELALLRSLAGLA
ncbi:hypothetical protein SAMN06295974_3747 [Plantibacter flavus]|uniref:Uncharacterized protein n=1 Tax=Plantibacter flavus TaxID=150123 RepID=A0A3N2BLG4_9MICO|nr:HAD domain-containing protein [Plantibacter flavus]ROR76105.1 hypothetical protein EDD42_4058 [Plantibacter flavus]SMG48517.1 hypothetical protein SAMN06295974_3747 [Plantibacter flavus]